STPCDVPEMFGNVPIPVCPHESSTARAKRVPEVEHEDRGRHTRGRRPRRWKRRRLPEAHGVIDSPPTSGRIDRVSRGLTRSSGKSESAPCLIAMHGGTGSSDG